MAIHNGQDHPSSSSPVARALLSKSPRSHVVFLSLLFLLFPSLQATPSQAQTGTPVVPVPSTYFGMMFNNVKPVWNNSGQLVEPINYGFLRVWDSYETAWPEVETSSGVFDWSALEADLKNVHGNNKNAKALYTMNRTPNWALGLVGSCTGVNGNPKQPACDTTCNNYGNYGLSTGGSAPGQCYPPVDLNPDGSGTDQIWKTWVTALSNEAVRDCATGVMACIQYYEIWNEINRNSQGFAFPNSTYAAPFMFPASSPAKNSGTSYYGSFAQLVRMLQDARCIIMGKHSLQNKVTATGTFDNAIDNAAGVGVPQSCTLTGIQCPACAYPAKIVAPSSGTFNSEMLNSVQDLLYCGNGATIGAPNYCNTGTDAASDVDIINFHMKPGNFAALDDLGTGVPYMETEISTQYCDVVGKNVNGCSGYTANQGILLSNELHKPLWGGESGYSGAPHNSWTGGKLANDDLTDHSDMQASFIARYALIQWSLGIQSFNWYDYDIGNVLNGSSRNGSSPENGDPALAFSSIYTWMVGQTMTSAPSNAGCVNASGTEWTCNFKGAGGYLSEAVWDVGTGYACSEDSYKGSGCSSYVLTVPGSWTYYQDLWGGEHAITAHQVHVSNLPILLENEPLPVK